MATFCSTTGKICINQQLLTLAKAVQLIFYDSKIHMFFSTWKNHWNRIDSSLDTVGSCGWFGRQTSCVQSKGGLLDPVWVLWPGAASAVVDIKIQ